jgi:hypothetical protein
VFSNQKEQAEIFRYLLASGFIKIEDVISWADSIIEQEKEPDYEIIEISLAGRKSLSDVLSLLKNVKGKYNQIIVIRKAMSKVLLLLELKPKLGFDVSLWLHKLMMSEELNEDEFGVEPFILDDAFEMAQKKIWGTEEDALIELKEYLQSQVNKLGE